MTQGGREGKVSETESEWNLQMKKNVRVALWRNWRDDFPPLADFLSPLKYVRKITKLMAKIKMNIL